MGLFDKIKEFVAGEEESPVTAASVLAKVREKYPHLRGIDDLSLSQSLYKKDPAKFSYLKTYAPDTTVPPALVPKSMRDDAFYKANPQEGTKDALKVIEQVKAKFPKYKSVDAKKLAVALETKNPTMFAGLSKKLMPGQTAIPKGETEAATIPLIPSGTMGATKPVSPVQVTPPVRPIETKPEPKVRPSVTSISPEEAKLPDGTKPLKFKNGIEAYLAVEKLAKPTLVEYPGRHGQTIRRIMTTEIPSFPPPPEDKGKDLVGKIVGKEEAFARGVGVSGVQIPELAYGATALVADSAEKLFGSGTASRVKDWALRGYQRASKVSEEVHGDEVKSVAESWKEAKKGNLDALGDWVSYAMGYGAGQLGESAAVAFLGGLVGSVVPGPGTAAGAVAGVTAKTATKGVIRGALERLVERQALKLTAEGVAASEAKKLAVKQIATAIGAASAIGAYAVVQEGGSIYPDAVKKAEEDGRKLNGYDLGRAWGTTLVAAGADGLWDMLGLGFLTGKVRIPGRLGKVARIVGTAVSGGLAGSGTESIQTAVERVGAGRKPFDQEGIQAIIESAAAGAIPGLGAGGVGATISGQPRANVQSLAATQEASPELLSYLDRVEKINREQASDVTESQQKEDVTKGPARAEFIGYQEGLPEDTPIPLYNVMGESPRALSTVGSEELKSLGIETPKTPSFEEWKAGGDVTEGQVSAKKLIEKLASANEISDAVAVEFVKHITPTGENFYKSYGEEFSPEKFRVLGATIPRYTQNGLNFAIKLAQGAKESTGAHEMFHAMKQMGFFSQDEMRVLEGRFGNEEKIADALGEYATRRTGAEAQSRIKAIFDRFLEFVKRVGSMLVGRGWTRPEDIFESVVKGRPGKRASGSEGSTRFSAPPQEPVFYSQLQSVLDQKMPNAAPVSMIKALIDPAKGNVKAEEVEWSGIEEFLKGKEKVTKSELLDFLKSNEIQIQEIEKGKTSRREEIEDLRRRMDDEYSRTGSYNGLDFELAELEGESGFAQEGQTKFSNYQLPGGENYREILLTLPEGTTPNMERVQEYQRKADELQKERDFIGDSNNPEWRRLDAELGDAQRLKLNYQRMHEAGLEKAQFRSSHFDEPNILAHVRANDRTTADGKKTLFLEEVQSDWHQKGREQGYQVGDKAKMQEEYNKLVSDGKEEFEARRIVEEKYGSGTVPNAPFKKTWHEMALKQMLRKAVEGGYDSISWTTGEQQAERYDLSKQVDSIEFSKNEDGSGTVSAIKDGRQVIGQSVGNQNELANLVGKDIAKKLYEAPQDKKYENGNTYTDLSGEGLKIGGEGMKGFYDQIIPSFLNKYTKKWGGRVGETKINIGPSEESRTALQAAERTGDSALIADALGKGKDRMETVHSLDITPSMRESVAQGQPMFKAEPKDQTQTPEFKRWFGNSKVVDADGKPLVVYHGSIVKNLTQFNLEKAVEVEGGFFFTSNSDVAHQYTFERAYGDIIGEKPLGRVVEAYLSLQNPLVWQTKPGQKTVDAVEMGRAIEEAKAKGHDGLIVQNIDDSIGMTGDMGDTYVAFKPTQIKSATGNSGTFDPNNPSILYQAERIPPTPETPGSPYFAAPRSNAHRRVPPPVLEALQSAEGKLNDLTVGQAGELSTLAPTRAMEVMDGKRFGLMKEHFLKPIQDADKSFQIELKSMRAEAKAVLHGLTADERRSVYNAIDLKHQIHSDKVKRAVDFLRKTYDDLLDRINTARAAAGKDPVQKRQNYITHYQELSVLNDILDMIGLNMTEVPNSMLTISMFTKPNSPYFQFAKRRLGEQTERDAEQAFLRYLEPALRTIHFSPATKNARDIIEYKVKIPSEYEGGKIDTVSLFGIRYPNAYRYLTNYLNVVSGKRPILDKIFPQGAAIAGVMNKLFAAGSIGGNISTVITQAASLRNTIAETGLFAFKGQMLINTPKGYRFFKKNSRIGLGRQYEPSTKGTRLLGSKALAKTHEAVSDLISIPVGLFDREMVGGAFLAGYFKGRSIGLSEADAIRYGDDVAERTQASANIVDRPPINTGKLKTALGQFQTFVYNEWSQIRNDMVKKAVLGENSKQGYGDGLSGIREGRDVGFKRFLYFSIAAIILSSMYDEADLPNPLKQEAFSLPFGNHHVNTVFQHIVNQIPFVGNIRFGGPPVVQMIKLSVDVFGPVRDRKIALRRLQNLGLRLIPGGGQISKSINAHRYFFKVPPQTMADKVRGYMFGPRRWKILNDDMRWLKENAGRLGLTRSKAYQYLNKTSTRSLLAETEKERTEARAKVESYAKRLRVMAESREAELLAREERRKARLAARR